MSEKCPKERCGNEENVEHVFCSRCMEKTNRNRKFKVQYYNLWFMSFGKREGKSIVVISDV